MPNVDEDFQALKELLPKLEDKFGGREDVLGWDAGYRWRDKKRVRGELVLRLHVLEKKEKDELEESAEFPETFQGRPIDVLVVSHNSHDGPVLGRIDPFCPGLSLRQDRDFPGTLGAIVINSDGMLSVLSAMHILGRPSNKEGAKIYQTGSSIATRYDAIAEFREGRIERDGDAALADLIEPREPAIEPVGKAVQFGAPTTAKLGDRLSKVGAGSGFSTALVDGIGSYKVQYRKPGGKIERVVVDGFILAPVDDNPDPDEIISSPADSGAIWYRSTDEDGPVETVGLHIAGNDQNRSKMEFGVACHLERIADRLKFSFPKNIDRKIIKTMVN